MDKKANRVWKRLECKEYTTFSDGLKTSLQLERPVLYVSSTGTTENTGHMVMNGLSRTVKRIDD